MASFDELPDDPALGVVGWVGQYDGIEEAVAKYARTRDERVGCPFIDADMKAQFMAPARALSLALTPEDRVAINDGSVYAAEHLFQGAREEIILIVRR